MSWIPLDEFVTSGDFQRIALNTKRVDLSTIAPGTILYQRDLRNCRRVADDLRGPCVFVSNFHDYPVTRKLADSLLMHPNVLEVFSVNLEAPQERMNQIPLGLKKVLNSMRAAGERERDILCYANFKPHKPQRLALWEMTQGWSWVAHGTYGSVEDYYIGLARSRYVLSPPGNGMDTYRTWEALAMGAIPIVLKSPLSPLYAGLPVLVVDDWRQLTPQLLESWTPPTTRLDTLRAASWAVRLDAARSAGVLTHG